MPRNTNSAVVLTLFKKPPLPLHFEHLIEKFRPSQGYLLGHNEFCSFLWTWVWPPTPPPLNNVQDLLFWGIPIDNGDNDQYHYQSSVLIINIVVILAILIGLILERLQRAITSMHFSAGSFKQVRLESKMPCGSLTWRALKNFRGFPPFYRNNDVEGLANKSWPFGFGLFRFNWFDSNHSDKPNIRIVFSPFE